MTSCRAMPMLAMLVLMIVGCGTAHAAQALRFDVFASSDADDSDVFKTGLSYDFRHDDIEHYRGIRIEHARFAPLGQPATNDERIYYRFADGSDAWKWDAMLGTDGDTWLGTASIHNEQRRRQEYFIEREVVETPIGLKTGLRYTFVGGAFDLPVDDRNLFTALLGVQDFTGDNTRLHLRGSYIHVLKPEWGLSAQLRTRYYHSSKPGEFDYFSPRWYAEAIPVLQLRRFHGGWQYQAAAGIGRQRDSESPARSARLVEASVTSPTTSRDWFFKAGLLRSNTPVTTGRAYGYTQATLEFTWIF